MQERCDESALREAEDENRPRQACDNGDDTDVARSIGPWVTSQIGGGIHDADDDLSWRIRMSSMLGQPQPSRRSRRDA